MRPVSYTHLDVYKRQIMNHLGKRICAALLAGAMTMALAACGQSETGTTGESAAGSSGESSEAAGEPVLSLIHI